MVNDENNYLDFVINQLKSYKNIDTRKKWLQDATNKKLLSAADKWLLFAMFHISVPIYKLIINMCFIKKSLLWIAKHFYTYAAKQFIIYGFSFQQKINHMTINFKDHYLRWKDIENTYCETNLNNENAKENFFFEVITNGAVEIFSKIIKRWNFLAHDHKTF